MVDTARTVAELKAIFADAQAAGSITPQDMRDFVESIDNPVVGGFLDWVDYTPGLEGTGWAVGNGAITGRYTQIGKTVHFQAKVVFGSTSTFGASASPGLWLPVTATSHIVGMSFQGAALDAGSTSYSLLALPDTGTVYFDYLSTSGAGQLVTATAPFTWNGTNGDTLAVNGTYEAA
jgi:hypothetical protein